MGRKAIRNNVSITITNDSNGKSYTASKRDFEKAIQKWQRRMCSLGLAFGIGLAAMSMPLITHIARDVNNTNSTKQAIEMAVSTDDYLQSIKSNVALQLAISAENITKIEDLKVAINDYKELKYKQGRTYGEEQRYMEACRTICESKTLVINLYTDTIKAKVAEAYGITDPAEIAKIKIQDPIHCSSTDGPEHNPNISMPDGTYIVKDYLFNPNKGMDSTLAENIIKARALLDERGFSENAQIKDLPVDDIIQTFEEAKKFEKNYKISLDKDGNLRTVKLEQTKSIKVEEAEK